MNELLKKQKEFDKKPTQTDQLGNLILIKTVPSDKLLGEFSIPKMNIYDLIDSQQKKDKDILKRGNSPKNDLKEENKKDSSHQNINKNNPNIKNNNTSDKNFILIDSSNKNNKNKNTKFSLNQNDIDPGPFVPAGSNFE